MSRVFVDTGAFHAIFSKTDRYATEAAAIYKRVLTRKALLYTTNLVIAETCNLFLRQGSTGYRTAVSFPGYVAGNMVPCAPDLPVEPLPPDKSVYLVYSTPDIERRAWDIFEKYDTARFSFTDCVSFAVMEAMKIKQAFTFDEHYDLMGFERLPAVEPTEPA